MPTNQQPLATPAQVGGGLTWLGYAVAGFLIYWAVKESKWFR